MRQARLISLLVAGTLGLILAACGEPVGAQADGPGVGGGVETPEAVAPEVAVAPTPGGIDPIDSKMIERYSPSGLAPSGFQLDPADRKFENMIRHPAQAETDAGTTLLDSADQRLLDIVIRQQAQAEVEAGTTLLDPADRNLLNLVERQADNE